MSQLDLTLSAFQEVQNLNQIKFNLKHPDIALERAKNGVEVQQLP
jgi:hypothetical protein